MGKPLYTIVPREEKPKLEKTATEKLNRFSLLEFITGVPLTAIARAKPPDPLSCYGALIPTPRYPMEVIAAPAQTPAPPPPGPSKDVVPHAAPAPAPTMPAFPSWPALPMMPWTAGVAGMPCSHNVGMGYMFVAIPFPMCPCCRQPMMNMLPTAAPPPALTAPALAPAPAKPPEAEKPPAKPAGKKKPEPKEPSSDSSEMLAIIKVHSKRHKKHKKPPKPKESDGEGDDTEVQHVRFKSDGRRRGHSYEIDVTEKEIKSKPKPKPKPKPKAEEASVCEETDFDVRIKTVKSKKTKKSAKSPPKPPPPPPSDSEASSEPPKPAKKAAGDVDKTSKEKPQRVERVDSSSEEVYHRYRRVSSPADADSPGPKRSHRRYIPYHHVKADTVRSRHRRHSVSSAESIASSPPAKPKMDSPKSKPPAPPRSPSPPVGRWRRRTMYHYAETVSSSDETKRGKPHLPITPPSIGKHAFDSWPTTEHVRKHQFILPDPPSKKFAESQRQKRAAKNQSTHFSRITELPTSDDSDNERRLKQRDHRYEKGRCKPISTTTSPLGDDNNKLVTITKPKPTLLNTIYKTIKPYVDPTAVKAAMPDSRAAPSKIQVGSSPRASEKKALTGINTKINAPKDHRDSDSDGGSSERLARWLKATPRSPPPATSMINHPPTTRRSPRSVSPVYESDQTTRKPRVPLMKDPGTLKSYSEVAHANESREWGDAWAPTTSESESWDRLSYSSRTFVDVNDERDQQGRQTGYLRVTETRRVRDAPSVGQD